MKTKNLFERLKPEYRILFDEYEQKYPSLGLNIKEDLQKNNFIGHCTYYTIADLMSLCNKDDWGYITVSSVFEELILEPNQ
jgi:hypothetical protein